MTQLVKTNEPQEKHDEDENDKTTKTWLVKLQEKHDENDNDKAQHAARGKVRYRAWQGHEHEVRSLAAGREKTQ